MHPALQRVRRSAAWWINRKFTCGTIGVVSNDRGQVLLVRERLRDRGVWGLPGGYLDRREAPEDAMRRELREELHVEAETIEFVSFCLQAEADHLDAVFTLTLQAGAVPRPGWEIREARWFDRDALPTNVGDNAARALAAAGVRST